MQDILSNDMEKDVNLPSGSSIHYFKKNSHNTELHCHDAVQVIIPLEHASFELFWSMENKKTESKPLTSGDICIIPPLLEHSARWTNAHFVNLYIPTSFIYESAMQNYDKDEELFNTQIGISDSFIYLIGATVRQHFLMHDSDNFKFFDALLVVLSNYLLNNCTIEIEEPIEFNGIDQIPCEKIRNAIIYMTIRLDQSISVEEIAHAVDMSQYHFMRTFKEMMGLSPAKYHTLLRIDKAKELLGKQQNIVDIAYDLGYSSQSHFSNVFTKTVGATPRKFQQNIGIQQ